MNFRIPFSILLSGAAVFACSASGGDVNGVLFDEAGTEIDAAIPDVTTPDSGVAKCGAGCKAGEVCSEGQCVELPKTCPCPAESYCDLAQGACKVGCTRDEECSAGRFCDEGKRTCKDGCRTEKDCAKVTSGVVACDEGACVTTCDTKFHACGKACKGDTDATACGAGCVSCPTRPNAAASCVSGACKSACTAGFHECGADCASNVAPATCGTSCSPCPGVTNGTASCDGTTCGFKCNAGYVPSGTTCVTDCVTKGCGSFEWCDSAATHLCKPGCDLHGECGSNQFCKISTHTCEATTSASSFCPAGFRSLFTCSNGHGMCVNASLPAATTFPFSVACPASSTARGSVTCSGPTYVCVPNDP